MRQPPDPDRLFIHSFSDREISHNAAFLQPMTPAIRRELYQKVNRKKLYLKYSFDDISLSEAIAVIDYADGKTEVMPPCLLTPEEARNIALQKQYNALNNIQLSDDKDPAKPEASPIKNTAANAPSAPNPALDRKFDLLTYRYSEEDRELLYSYRNLLNDLASYGIAPEQASEYLAQHESRQQTLIALQKQMITLKNDYKELCRLKGYIDLAENDHFLRGPLFEKEKTISEETMATEPGEDMTLMPEEHDQIHL